MPKGISSISLMIWESQKQVSDASNKAIVSAAIVLRNTCLIFLEFQHNREIFPSFPFRNTIKPPWEEPSLRLAYDASQKATKL